MLHIKIYSILFGAIIAVWLISLIASNTLWTSFLAERFIEIPALSYKNLPFPALLPQVMAGEIIPLQINRCNSSDENQNYNTTRTLENIVTHESYLLPESRTLIKPGCDSVTSRFNLMPEDLPSGRYYLYGTAEVRGHAHLLIVDWRSPEFNVIGK